MWRELGIGTERQEGAASLCVAPGRVRPSQQEPEVGARREGLSLFVAGSVSAGHCFASGQGSFGMSRAAPQSLVESKLS